MLPVSNIKMWESKNGQNMFVTVTSRLACLAKLSGQILTWCGEGRLPRAHRSLIALCLGYGNWERFMETLRAMCWHWQQPGRGKDRSSHGRLHSQSGCHQGFVSFAFGTCSFSVSGIDPVPDPAREGTVLGSSPCRCAVMRPGESSQLDVAFPCKLD